MKHVNLICFPSFSIFRSIWFNPWFNWYWDIESSKLPIHVKFCNFLIYMGKFKDVWINLVKINDFLENVNRSECTGRPCIWYSGYILFFIFLFAIYYGYYVHEVNTIWRRHFDDYRVCCLLIFHLFSFTNQHQ